MRINQDKEMKYEKNAFIRIQIREKYPEDFLYGSIVFVQFDGVLFFFLKVMGFSINWFITSSISVTRCSSLYERPVVP